MRLSAKLGASLSAAALGSAVVLGGAGIAQAQSAGSLGSLGSSDPAPVVLTVEGDKDSVGGTITNNTGEAITCTVAVMDASVIAQIEGLVADGKTVKEASTELDEAVQKSNSEGKNALALGVAVAANDTADWDGVGSYGPAEDYRSGAVATCGDEVAFAYESTGAFGSLDMGSLGS